MSSSASSATSPTRVGPWKCKYCTLAFTREIFLVMHIERYHEAERQRLRVVRERRRMREVRCDICGQWCINFERFLHHRLSHNFPMKHACKDCGKLFQTKAHYKMHKKVHLPPSHPHRCLYCQKSFQTEFDLWSHWTRTHGRRTESESHSRRGTLEGAQGNPLLLQGNQKNDLNLNQIKVEIKSEPLDENQGVASGTGQIDFETGIQETVDQVKLAIKSEPADAEPFYESSGVLGSASPQDDPLTRALNEGQIELVTEAASHDGNLLEDLNTGQIKMEIKTEPSDANQGVASDAGQIDFGTEIQPQGGNLRVDLKTVDQIKSEVKPESEPSYVESFYASPIVLGTATPLDGMLTLCLNEDQMEFVAETTPQDGNLFEDFETVDQIKIESESEPLDENQGVASGMNQIDFDFEEWTQPQNWNHHITVDQIKSEINSEPADAEPFYASSDLLGQAGPQDDPLPLPLKNEDQMDFDSDTTSPVVVDYQTTPPDITVGLNDGQIESETRNESEHENGDVVATSHKVASQPQRAVFVMKPGTEGVVVSHDEGSITFSGSKAKGGTTVIEDVKFMLRSSPNSRLATCGEYCCDSKNREDEMNVWSS